MRGDEGLTVCRGVAGCKALGRRGTRVWHIIRALRIHPSWPVHTLTIPVCPNAAKTIRNQLGVVFGTTGERRVRDTAHVQRERERERERERST